MTLLDFASMTDAELNEAALVARNLPYVIQPADDDGHADAFLLWFLAQERAAGRWWNCVTETVVEQRSGEQVYVRKVTLSRELGAPGMVFVAKGESLARCVTVAVLEAAHAGKVVKNG